MLFNQLYLYVFSSFRDYEGKDRQKINYSGNKDYKNPMRRRGTWDEEINRKVAQTLLAHEAVILADVKECADGIISDGLQKIIKFLVRISSVIFRPRSADHVESLSSILA